MLMALPIIYGARRSPRSAQLHTMLQKYYRVRFLDLNETYTITANKPRYAVEEAIKTLRDCGIIASYPRTPEEMALLGRIRVGRAKNLERQV